MPKFDRETVRELVTSRIIKGVSFDTNVVDSFAPSGNLRHPMLKALAGLHDKGVPIIVSEVVARETRKHFIESMMEAYRQAKVALHKLGRAAGNTGGKVAAATNALPTEQEQKDSLDSEFTAFIDMLKATVIKADDYATFSVILDRYFAGESPFDNPKKKAEFPDAIAIASLQAWSDREGPIIAVSSDGDWRSAFESSDNVHLVVDLRSALAIFQEDDKLAEALADAYRKGDETVLAALKGAV